MAGITIQEEEEPDERVIQNEKGENVTLTLTCEGCGRRWPQWTRKMQHAWQKVNNSGHLCYFKVPQAQRDYWDETDKRKKPGKRRIPKQQPAATAD